MSSNMAINGPAQGQVQAANIGGNTVQPTPDGRFKVTTAKGKVKILTEDQFIRQIKKNQENLKAGKDFEIKKGMSPAAKIIGFLAGAGAIVAAVVYRKNIAKFFKKTGEKIADVIKGKSKNTNTIFSDKAGFTTKGKEAKNEAIVAMSKDNFGYEISNAKRATMKADAEAAFANYDGEAVLKGLKEGKKPQELGLTVKEVKPQVKDPEKMVKLKDVPNIEPAKTPNPTSTSKAPEAPKAPKTPEAAKTPKKAQGKKNKKANAQEPQQNVADIVGAVKENKTKAAKGKK